MFICLLSSCNSLNYTEVVVFHNERYERYNGDFSPVGNLSPSAQRCYRGYYSNGKTYNTSDYIENTNVQTYAGDIDNIFIFVGGDKSDEGHIYHKMGDRFPDYTDESLISKIEIWHYGSSELVDLAPADERDLLDLITNMNKGLVKETQKASTGYANAGLIICFKDYPATDNSILLMESKYLKNGKTGLYFSSSDLNKKLLGGSENVAIIPSKLALELKTE
jgi:hypothetical protein